MFAASPPARAVFLGKLFEVCANQSGQGSILLNRDFANLLDQFVIKGQGNVHITIRGLKLNDLQCIGFKMPVVFAESANVPNDAYVADLYEQVSFLGDLHRQIANTPNRARVRLRVGRSPAQP